MTDINDVFDETAKEYGTELEAIEELEEEAENFKNSQAGKAVEALSNK